MLTHRELSVGAFRSTINVSEMPALSKKDKLQLLTTILESRHGDLREQNLNRQGKGHFHVSGMGHEALAAISVQMEPDDYICPYYRDRALVLGRGVASRELALDPAGRFADVRECGGVPDGAQREDGEGGEVD